MDLKRIMKKKKGGGGNASHNYLHYIKENGHTQNGKQMFFRKTVLLQNS